MKRVLTAVVLIPLVLTIVLWDSLPIFTVAVGVVAVLCLLEYQLLISSFSSSIPRFTTVAIAVAFFCLLAIHFYIHPGNPKLDISFLDVVFFGAAFMVAVPGILMTAGMRCKDLKDGFIGGFLSIAGLSYVVLPFVALVGVYAMHRGRFLVLFLFVTVWTGDIAAYYLGRTLGKHKLAPAVSPGKSWEGAIASVVFSSLAAWILTRYASPLLPPRAYAPIQPVWWQVCSMAIPINIAAQLGDLSESLLKRAAGVKDSGTILPGHGGVLDRVDALLLAAPVGILVFFFATAHFLQ